MLKRIFTWMLCCMILPGICAMPASAAGKTPTRPVEDAANYVPRDEEYIALCSPQRPYYDLGTCRDLSGKIFFVTIFLDDSESKWNETDMQNYWSETVHPGLAYLEDEAANRGVRLKFETAGYSTGMSEGVNAQYEGNVGNEVTQGSFSKDLLTQAVMSLGFTGEDHYYERMQEFSGCEQVITLIALNKPGRGYAMPDQSDDDFSYVEYFVLFSSYLGSDTKTVPASIAHETLHLFGAEDYYDPYGDMPNRKEMADKLYPNDIMNQTYYDISYNEIGNFTAFTIGWTHQLPQECDCDEWWS